MTEQDARGAPVGGEEQVSEVGPHLPAGRAARSLLDLRPRRFSFLLCLGTVGQGQSRG